MLQARTVFDRVAGESTVQLLTLVGEPGVGKSRIVAELFAYIDGLLDVVRWRQGRCLPYGEGITFWALGEIVKAHAGVFESDPPDEAQSKLERVLPESDEMPWLRARLLPLLGIEAGPGRVAGGVVRGVAALPGIDRRGGPGGGRVRGHPLGR